MERLFEKYNLNIDRVNPEKKDDLEDDERKYLEDLRRFEKIIVETLSYKYRNVEKVFQGDMNFEAIVAYDREDELAILINLDLDTIDELREAELENRLKEYIEAYA